ncbi:MAG: hypothetical protein ABEJ77_07575 [Halanaeroarchaeum sp.]
MSEERPSREVAYRVFAAEFDDADESYAESDEERAPNYVVTPTGARINRLFVVGVLTAVERVNDDVLRARIADPTGAFVVYAGQYQPEAMAFFDRTEPPAFVAVTGKARTFEPEDGDAVYTSIRPETANEVTAETRDRWVVQTATRTLDRIETMAGARRLSERGDALRDALRERGVAPGLAAGVARALDHYGTTTGYLEEMRRVSVDATRVVANELDEVDPPTLAPADGEDVTLEIEGSFSQGEDRATETTIEDESGADERKGRHPDESASEGDRDESPPSAADESMASGEAEDATAPPEPDETSSVPETEGEQTVSTEGEETVSTEESRSATGESALDEGGEDDAAGPAGGLEGDEEASEGPDADDDEETYELSPEERAAVEEEYDVGFETGNEVGEPGEAGIDAPGPEDSSASVAEGPDDEGEAGESDAETDADVDLEDAVVEAMADLDDGDGAPRDAILARVSETQDVAPDAVEDALQDALMGGRCYESGEDRFTPI